MAHEETGRYQAEIDPRIPKTRPIPCGEFDGPFFRPETLEKIKKRGNKPLSLIGFMSAEGLHVIPEKTDTLFDLLSKEQYGLTGILKKTPKGDIIFPSKTITQVAEAIELASSEQIMHDSLIGGIDSFNQIGNWLAQNVGSGS